MTMLIWPNYLERKAAPGLCRTFTDLADAAARADPVAAGRSARAYVTASAGELWQPTAG